MVRPSDNLLPESGRSAAIADLDDLEPVLARRQPHLDDIADGGAGQRPRHGRGPADQPLGEVGLVDADDGDALLLAGLVT